jgi:hypothetical protein
LPTPAKMLRYIHVALSASTASSLISVTRHQAQLWRFHAVTLRHSPA